MQRFNPFLFLFLASVSSSSRSVCNSSRIKLCWRCRFKNVTDRPDGLSKKYSNLNVIGRSATPHFPSGTATATATALQSRWGKRRRRRCLRPELDALRLGPAISFFRVIADLLACNFYIHTNPHCDLLPQSYPCPIGRLSQDIYTHVRQRKKQRNRHNAPNRKSQPRHQRDQNPGLDQPRWRRTSSLRVVSLLGCS